MSPRRRGLSIVLISFFAGGMSTCIVEWGPLREAAMAGAVTIVVLAVLLVVMPRG